MWRAVNCALSLLLCLYSGPLACAAEEPNEQVKIEVVYKPIECNRRSKRGDLLNVHYDGFLEKDGSQFYCSRSHKTGHPEWFVVGVGQVIKGLDIGLVDMCAGEKRKITVPPSLGFGEKGKDPVPPNATLVFEVELYAVTNGPRTLEAFKQMDGDKDKSLTKEEVKAYLRKEYERDEKPRDEAFFEKIMEDIFRKNDQDRDGVISKTEYNIFGHDEL